MSAKSADPDIIEPPSGRILSTLNWLRAGVLGANDGVVSTASIIFGVAGANAAHGTILLAGIASVAAGALSMAAGEYVSVSSQADTEQADLNRERLELESQPNLEREELAQLYARRGVDIDLARRVAEQLMQKDALEAHAREELGISEITTARPIVAALTSALTFAVGATMPLAMVWLAPADQLVWLVSAASLLFLALLGAIGAKGGGADVMKATIRVTFWGAFAMALTAGIGALVGTAV